MIAIGVDTHKEQHLAVALDDLGQLLAEIAITTNPAGYRKLVDWLAGLDGQVLVGIEGAGSYEARLCEYLQAKRVEVFEVERPRHRERRTGKSDRIDALLGTKKVLARDGLSTPRGSRDTRGATSAARRLPSSVIGERSRLYNQLQAPSRQRTRRSAGKDQPSPQRRKARRSPHRDAHTPTASSQENTTLQVLRDIANRTRALDTQANSYTREIEEPVRSMTPTPPRGTRRRADLRRQAPRIQPSPLHQRGGIRTRQRHRTTTRLLRQDDPPPTQPQRRPPNQRRDTHNRLPRSVHHTPSRDYMQRRITEGKTKREAMRSLKRYPPPATSTTSSQKHP